MRILRHYGEDSLLAVLTRASRDDLTGSNARRWNAIGVDRGGATRGVVPDDDTLGPTVNDGEGLVFAQPVGDPLPVLSQKYFDSVVIRSIRNVIEHRSCNSAQFCATRIEAHYAPPTQRHCQVSIDHD